MPIFLLELGEEFLLCQRSCWVVERRKSIVLCSSCDEYNNTVIFSLPFFFEVTTLTPNKVTTL